MPQFARRLAPPAHQPASRTNPAPVRQGSRSGPPQGPIYDNGPINGNVDAWTINFGYVTSDTITVGSGSGVDGMTFGAWLLPGDTLTSAEVSITSSENGGTSYFDQYVNFSQSGCTANQLGYNVCTVSTTFNGPNLNAGTYWVNLQNASVPSGDPVYWDENSGVGCESGGCPSQASANDVGTIPSESFTMEGSGGAPSCFESGGSLQILYNFTTQEGAGNGVAIDRGGNLYGTNPNGGNNSAGFAYKLAYHLSWLLDPLFNFFGGNTGGEPTGGILGPNGSLYGGAQGGIQNCGSGSSQYCGLVFNLTPQATACKTSLCYWNENVPYRFTSDADGSGVINVSAYDQEGNLYGTTSTGGANGAGTVFELTPSGGSWTKTTLYSFTGGNDGGTPTQVLVGNDGNLYGVAGGGFSHNGVVFQLTPSGGQWTEGLVHTFNGEDGFDPGYLVQDSAGNLYGIANVFEAGAIFTLQKTGSNWAFSQYSPGHSCMPVDLPYGSVTNLAIDVAGNLYGTGGGGEEFAGSLGRKRPGEGTCFYNYIFKASYGSQGWNYEDLYFSTNTYFGAAGSLALDTSGNLHGTTSDCGTYGSGTVWQLSP
jgi:uncharacterized repeat protein (TIGR03803 family)